MLGQPERVEAELLHHQRQLGRCDVEVGERGGDAEPHRQAGGRFAANSARVPDCAATSEDGAERALLPAVRVQDGVAPRRPHQGHGGRGWRGAGATRSVPPGRRSPRAPAPGWLTFSARPSSTSSAAPTQSEVSRMRGGQRLPAHGGGEEEAAAGLGRYPSSAKGTRNRAAGSTRTRSRCPRRVKPRPAATVRRGEQGHRNVGEHLEQPDEAAARTLHGRPGGHGGHLGQVLARGERAAASGEHDGAHPFVVVPRRARPRSPAGTWRCWTRCAPRAGRRSRPAAPGAASRTRRLIGRSLVRASPDRRRSCPSTSDRRRAPLAHRPCVAASCRLHDPTPSRASSPAGASTPRDHSGHRISTSGSDRTAPSAREHAGQGRRHSAVRSGRATPASVS